MKRFLTIVFLGVGVLALAGLAFAFLARSGAVRCRPRERPRDPPA